jgi:hypothetical protein
MSILDSIKQSATAGAVQQVSQRLGVDRAMAQRIVNTAFPVIMGGIAAHARSAGGASAIHAEATKHADATPPAAAIPQILGARQDAVADQVSQTAGVSREDAGKVISAVAPSVLQGIGQHVRDGGLDPSQLKNMLGSVISSAGGASYGAGEVRP